MPELRRSLECNCNRKIIDTFGLGGGRVAGRYGRVDLEQWSRPDPAIGRTVGAPQAWAIRRGRDKMPTLRSLD